MCPACLANMALVAVGATSAGGVAEVDALDERAKNLSTLIQEDNNHDRT